MMCVAMYIAFCCGTPCGDLSLDLPVISRRACEVAVLQSRHSGTCDKHTRSSAHLLMPSSSTLLHGNMTAGRHSFISSTLMTLACDAGTATVQRWRRARRRPRWPPAEGSCAASAVGAALWSSSGRKLLLLQLRLLLLLLAPACTECRRDFCCYAVSDRRCCCERRRRWDHCCRLRCGNHIANDVSCRCGPRCLLQRLRRCLLCRGHPAPANSRAWVLWGRRRHEVTWCSRLRRRHAESGSCPVGGGCPPRYSRPSQPATICVII